MRPTEAGLVVDQGSTFSPRRLGVYGGRCERVGDIDEFNDSKNVVEGGSGK